MTPSWLLEFVTMIIAFVLQVSMIFATDDMSSDLVNSYYQIYWNQVRSQLAASASEASTSPILLEQDVPEEITEKLQEIGLDFNSLPSLLQRALIWDSGYVLGDDGYLATIYARCQSNNFGFTMSNLGITTKQIVSAGCKLKNCSANSSSTAAWSFSSDCGPMQLDDIVQCASTSVKTTANESPVWATGQQSEVSTSKIPEALVRRHTWSDTTAGRSAILFAIHTQSKLEEESYSTSCTSEKSLPSLTIPCIQYRASDDRWCRPKSSARMTKWLNEYIVEQHDSSASLRSNSYSSGFANTSIPDDSNNALADTNATRLQNDDTSPGNWNHTIPVLIVGGAALVVTGIAVFIYLRRRSDQRKADLYNSAANQLSLSSPSSSNRSANESRIPHDNPLIDKDDIFGNPRSLHDVLEMLSSSPSAWASSPLALSMALTAESLASGSPSGPKSTDNCVRIALANDPHLKDAQIPFELLQFHHLISRSFRSEVWLCVLHDRCVAVKRLHKEHRRDLDEIKAFVRSIRVIAPLQHPSILGFVGVTWSFKKNLCLVTEYLELGDLQEYLCQSNPNRDHNDTYEDFMSLSWKREKMQLLLDITRGLVYLHQHRIIHGDLKASNVLLSSALDAKLTGFGGSSQYSQEMSTLSHQSTPFWTAPEVLAGGLQTDKADIYSLGVVVAELDTHRAPYANAVAARGGRMTPIQVLQRIMSGQLKPTFSATCPDEIQELAEWCLHRDPNFRPSSRDVVQALRSIPGVNLDEFSL